MSPKTTPKFSVPQDEVWLPVTYHSSLHIVPALLVLCVWSYIVYVLYWALVTARGPFVPGYGFIAYFVLLATYPVLYIVNEIFTIYKAGKDGDLSGMDPYYGFCVIGPDSLTKEEIGFGAVGAMDYRCHAEQYELTNSQSNYLISSTYYVVYALFALVLFFFTQSAGPFKDVIANRDSVFVTAVIKYALILSLLIMGLSVLQDYYYLTMVINYFLLNVLQLIGALMLMLISFILYRFTFLFK